jgi:tRNA G18 (ribose-2'-O)-methylase SpoU
MTDIDWAEKFNNARSDRQLALLEGFHPLKHALRFHADILDVVTDDMEELLALSRRLAPDLMGAIEESTTIVSKDLFHRLLRDSRETDVLAIARRRIVSADVILKKRRDAPVILLEEPSHLGNVGAAIRAAASAGASAVVTTGRHDPWHAEAIRGSAGLHYAVPVAHSSSLGAYKGPLVAVHPEGDPLRFGSVPRDAILAFGSERQGLSDVLLEKADHRISIPMEPDVSSMNLASAVAVVLYAWRLVR